LAKKRNLGFAIISILICLIFVEISLRICFPLPELRNFNRINYQILDRVDNQQGYLRNIKMQWKSVLDTSHTFVHELNTYGYRDANEWKVEKGNKKRFFFVGDSFVEGMMSTADQTIPNGFAKAALQNKEEYELFNCGMMGIGLNEYIKLLKDAVPIFNPDEVFLVLYSNDAPFQRQYVPQNRLIEEKYSFWTPRIMTLIEHIQSDDPIPFRFAKENRPFYKAVPDPGNPWTTNSTDLSKHVTPEIAVAMKKGDFNYFRTNWILEEEKFLKADINLRDKLSFLKSYLAKYNTKLNVYYVPSRSQVSNYYYQFEKQACLVNCPDNIDLTLPLYQKHAAILQSDCNILGIPFYDFTPMIKSKESNGNHLYWDYDDHMRGKGYMMIGREIYKRWSSL